MALEPNMNLSRHTTIYPTRSLVGSNTPCNGVTQLGQTMGFVMVINYIEDHKLIPTNIFDLILVGIRYEKELLQSVCMEEMFGKF